MHPVPCSTPLHPALGRQSFHWEYCERLLTPEPELEAGREYVGEEGKVLWKRDLDSYAHDMVGRGQGQAGGEGPGIRG